MCRGVWIALYSKIDPFKLNLRIRHGVASVTLDPILTCYGFMADHIYHCAAFFIQRFQGLVSEANVSPTFPPHVVGIIFNTPDKWGDRVS